MFSNLRKLCYVVANSLVVVTIVVIRMVFFGALVYLHCREEKYIGAFFKCKKFIPFLVFAFKQKKKIYICNYIWKVISVQLWE